MTVVKMSDGKNASGKNARGVARVMNMCTHNARGRLRIYGAFPKRGGIMDFP